MSYSEDNEDALPAHKRANYLERMLEMADYKKKELREIGATCNNCRMLVNEKHHCYMFKERPATNVCYAWRQAV
jgi:hypothetical protein